MKLKIFFAVLLLASVFCVTTTALAMTEQERQTLIAQIQAQIAQLTQQLNQMLAEQQGTETWCHSFNIDLDTGDTGSEVVALQTAFQKEGFTISASEIQNQQFGSTTGQAVKDFKIKYSSQIVTAGTTKVGEITRGMLNQLYGCATTNPPPCAPDWQCGSWSTCTDNQQTRNCYDSNYCGVTTGAPSQTQSCTSACVPDWYCTSWDTCSNSQQTRTCTDSNSCGTTTGQPATTQSCTNTCTPIWQCGDWSTCTNNQQTRNCYDSNYCGVTTGAPSQTQSCTSACVPDWYCTSWDTCSNSQQTRTCTDSNSCGTAIGKPAETQSCTISCAPSWSCSSWTTCSGGQQTRNCTDSNSCGVTINKPSETQTCVVCTDTDNLLGGIGQSTDGSYKGWNYWYKGTATGILISGSTPSQPSTILGQGSFTDTCKDSKNLKEYICHGDNVFSYDTYCPLGCVNGACNQGLSIFNPSSTDVWNEGYDGWILWSFNGKSLPTTPVNIYLVKGNIKMQIAQSALPDDEASGSSGAFAQYRYIWAPWRPNIVGAYKSASGNYLYDSTGKIGINFPGKVWRMLVEYNGQSQYSDFFEIKALEYGTDFDSGASDASKVKGVASGWAGRVSSDGKELIGSYMADPAGAGGSYSIKLYYGQVTLTDFCWNNSVLIEYSVIGPYITSTYYPCPLGQRCSLGRCN